MKETEENGILLLSKWRNVLMGFAALWIFAVHIYIPMLKGTGIVPQAEVFLKRIGFCGVDIFFMLSGMGLTYAIQKSGILKFYWSRIKRVMIPFVIVGVIFGTLDHWDTQWMINNLLGINFYKINIYSFLWFVPAVMTFYLLFPLYWFFFSRSRNKVLFTLGGIALWLLLSLLFQNVMREDLYGFTNRIPILMMGILFGWLCQHGTVEFCRFTWLFFAIVLTLGLYLAYQTNFKGMEILVPVSNCCMPNFLTAISLSFLIAKFFDVFSRIPRGKFLPRGFAGFFRLFGMMSLEFYCVQEWLAGRYMEGYINRFGIERANLLIFLLVTACGLILHYVAKVIWLIIGAIEKGICHLTGTKEDETS